MPDSSINSSGDRTDTPALGARRPATPERYHEQNHSGTFGDCWRCQRALSICRSKVRYESWAEAAVAVLELNEREGYVKPVVRYRCRWCLFWHLTSAARDKYRAKRAEKQRRKWLVRNVLDGSAPNE